MKTSELPEYRQAMAVSVRIQNSNLNFTQKKSAILFLCSVWKKMIALGVPT